MVTQKKKVTAKSKVRENGDGERKMRVNGDREEKNEGER